MHSSFISRFIDLETMFLMTVVYFSNIVYMIIIIRIKFYKPLGMLITFMDDPSVRVAPFNCSE